MCTATYFPANLCCLCSNNTPGAWYIIKKWVFLPPLRFTFQAPHWLSDERVHLCLAPGFKWAISFYIPNQYNVEHQYYPPLPLPPRYPRLAWSSLCSWGWPELLSVGNIGVQNCAQFFQDFWHTRQVLYQVPHQCIKCVTSPTCCFVYCSTGSSHPYKR